MKMIKTPNHIIMTVENTPPKFSCKGECKKVWWESDMHISASSLMIPSCPMCGGKLKLATRMDYKSLN